MDTLERLTLTRLWKALESAGVALPKNGAINAHADKRGAVSTVAVWPTSLAHDVRDALVAAGLDDSPVRALHTPPDEVGPPDSDST